MSQMLEASSRQVRSRDQLRIPEGIYFFSSFSVLVDAELDVAVDLDEYGPFLDFENGAVDSAGGDNLITLLEGVAEIFEFLLLLALRTDHEKPHDEEHQDNHYPEAHTASGALPLCGAVRLEKYVK